jgi:excisionase family DNA binding protein
VTDLLTVPEVADLLRVNTDTSRRLMRSGVIRASKVGARWRAARTDVEAYLDSTANVAPVPVVTRRKRQRRRAS